MGTLLIGYDVEWLGEGDVTPRFLEQARSLHNQLGVPATLFVVGQTLERWVPQFQAIAGDPLFDIQQHTYSHQLLKTVFIEDGRSVRVVRGVSIDETREEVEDQRTAGGAPRRGVHRVDRALVLLPRPARPPGHPAGALGGRHPL